MHIEPGVVEGAKITLSYVTAVGAAGLIGKMAMDTIRNDGGIAAFGLRSTVATLLVFSFFELLPHWPVGVSEVHLILGSTLFLLFGAGPAALGLALGLLAQGVLFAPFDLPQYGMNLTTLVLPLWAVSILSRRVIGQKTPYVELKYSQALALSTAYQAGIVAWVAFWALYGQGFGAENLGAVSAFGASYLLVIAAEPLIDLLVLAGAKAMRLFTDSPLFNMRLHSAA